MKTLKEMMLPVPMDSGFKMDGYWVWCASVIKGEDSKYHMFASRWEKTLPMHPGWLLKSEVVHAVSDNVLGPYRFSDVALPERGPEFWDGCMTHNPHIKKVGDTYVLYYIGTTYPFTFTSEEITLSHPAVISARAGKRVGVAYSKSVFGPWKRADRPLLDTRPCNGDSYLTSNPAPCLNENGEVFMVYKGRKYIKSEQNPYLYSDMRLFTAKGRDAFSPLERREDNIILQDAMGEIEDPFLWYDKGYHMIAKDMTGAVCGEKYAGIHAFSENGTSWKIDGTPFYSRKIIFEDGKERIMGNMERPFIFFEDGVPVCAFFAVSDNTDGTGILNCCETHNIAIPLKGGK